MFKKNLTMLSFVNLYVKATGLVIVPFMARRFTVEEFGVLALTQSILGYVLDCFDGGVKKVGIRELSQKKDREFGHIAQEIFSARILLLAAAFLVMNLTGFLLFHEPQHRVIVSIISLTILVQILDITWIYDARQNMGPASLSKIIERTVYFGISVMGIGLVSINALAFAFPVSILAASLWIWFNKNELKMSFFQFKLNKGFIKEGLLIGFAGIAASLCLTIDQLMVKKILDAYQLGLYSAATKVAFVILTFLWIYAYALFPRLSMARNDKAAVRQIMDRHALFLGLAGTLTVLFLGLSAKTIILLIFSDKYLVTLPVFRWLNFFLLICFFNVLFSDGLNAFSRQADRLAIILQALVINIVLNVFFIPLWGLTGAVMASIGAQIFILYYSFRRINKDFNVTSGWKVFAFIVVNFLQVLLSFKFGF